MIFGRRPTMVTPDQALPGRATPVLDPGTTFHRIFGDRLDRQFEGAEVAYLAAGCFWGVEKLYWNTPGVLQTAVGYQGGTTPNPTYEEVCSGLTGHTETVRVTFDPSQVSYEQLLRIFFENHDPTQGYRQGNDIGTQYRSAIFTTSPQQEETARQLFDQYSTAFAEAGYPALTTEVVEAGPLYLAEDYHQQYLDANPNGYCPIHATGVRCG
ncbi:peptide-methionine (S)-S-oxide reductase MsrA [Aestuariimicrobium ganziense]|uniref:peptide-methionine (S)-S-oxide reductase MsrA n=1 Tax=Aestuariimicrobium ganziense TaxID=2773677 RepID=UPI0019405B03|nr:peptide-methionine (S)-S-oxide reductase MsrA [Aestuariimicrobium ganziense]